MKGLLTIESLRKAIVEDRKDQTRRVIKDCSGIGDPRTLLDSTCKETSKHIGDLYFDNEPNKFYKPRYKVGERVYLKEPYWDFGYYHAIDLTKAGYRKWVSVLDEVSEPIVYPYDGADMPNGLPFGSYTTKSEISDSLQWKLGNKYFMPEKYARSFVDVVSVGVERLQDISEKDALSEGGWEYKKCPFHKSPIKSFEKLWDSINNPPYSWEDNPFNFVYGLKHVK